MLSNKNNINHVMIPTLMLNISIELTDACNLTCKMCSQSGHKKKPHNRPVSYLSFEQWKKAILSLGKIQRSKQLCPFWDGESLLHPEFGKFIRFAFDSNNNNSLFNSFRLHTNGVLLNEKIRKDILHCASLKTQKEDTFIDIHFSIDSITKETYKKIKGTDNHAQTVKNIINLLKEREEQGLKYPKITVAMIVMKENIHEGKAFADYWKKLFKSLNIDFQIAFDWPNERKDAIYFRRLNSDKTEENEKLHKTLAKTLGFQKEELRSKGSF